MSVWADIAIKGSQITVTFTVAELLLKQYPALAKHACKSGRNSKSRAEGTQHRTERATFGDHLVGALLPHAVEHLVIELMVQAHPGETFAGNTRWISREEQHMRVRISRTKHCTSEEIAVTFSEAIRQLNKLIAMCE